MSQAATTLDMEHIEHEATEKTTFGFWVYLMTDCVLFASLFATYAVLHRNTYGGPGGAELFSLPYVLVETMVLLASSFTCGLAMIAARKRDMAQVLVWLAVTFILGATFLTLELSEFHAMVADGESWRQSAFLSSYFTLVGTHGLHITIGLIWLATLAVLLFKKGFSHSLQKRLMLFSLFWHFLDVVWIFIFTIVYLFGAMNV